MRTQVEVHRVVHPLAPTVHLVQLAQPEIQLAHFQVEMGLSPLQLARLGKALSRHPISALATSYQRASNHPRRAQVPDVEQLPRLHQLKSLYAKQPVPKGAMPECSHKVAQLGLLQIRDCRRSNNAVVNNNHGGSHSNNRSQNRRSR